MFWQFLNLPEQFQYAANSEKLFFLFLRKPGFPTVNPIHSEINSTVTKLSLLELGSVFLWEWKAQLELELVIGNIDWGLPLHKHSLGASCGLSHLIVPRTLWGWEVILLLFYRGDEGSEKSKQFAQNQTAEKWWNQDLTQRVRPQNLPEIEISKFF